MCTGELGAQISFCAFDEDFRGNVVFTGDRGDSIWDKNTRISNDEFAFNDILSHLGSAEHALRVGYVSCPMPLYGATAWGSIHDISCSNEMTAWSIGGDYDRPIPRRIVEEAGIERSSFGQYKHGAGFSLRYDWGARMLRRLSPASAEDFKRFSEKCGYPSPSEVAKYLWITKGVYLKRLGVQAQTPTLRELAMVSNPMAPGLLVPWAGAGVLERYKTALLEGSGNE